MKVNLRIGPTKEWSFFKINDRLFMINKEQNILYILFPFLMWIFPLKCYEVKNDLSFSRNLKKKKLDVKVPLIYITPGILLNFIDKLNVGIHIPALISISLAIILVIFIWFKKRTKLKSKIIQEYKVRIYPDGFYDGCDNLSGYCMFLLGLGISIGFLYRNPNNLWWFMSVGMMLFAVLFSSLVFLCGNMKVKFLNCNLKNKEV